MAPDPTADTEDLEVVVARLLAATGMAQERQAQLQRALDTRILIEQAKGMLAERHGIGVQDAFEILRGAARSNRRRVHDVARGVVEGDPAIDDMLSRGR